MYNESSRIRWSRSILVSVQRLEWYTSEIPLDNWTSWNCMQLHRWRKFELWPKWHSRWKEMSSTSSWLYKSRGILAWPSQTMTMQNLEGKENSMKFLGKILESPIDTCSVLYMTSARNIELIGKSEKMTPLLMSAIILASLVMNKKWLWLINML